MFIKAILLSVCITFTANMALAGEKEEVVFAGCAATSSDGYSYAACVAGGLTQNEAETCINTPRKCFGPNNEFRKLLCSVGIGCPSQPYVNDLKQVIPYKGGCIAIFRSGTYYSPDCQNLRGGGKTENVWNVEQPHANLIQGIVVFHDCVITAFSGGGIYRSCDGRNLGGGGNTTKLYQGPSGAVLAMVNHRNALITAFSGGGIYRSTDGFNPGGGGDTTRLYQGRPVRSLTTTPQGLRTIFNDGSCYLDSDGLHPAGGPDASRC